MIEAVEIAALGLLAIAAYLAAAWFVRSLLRPIFWLLVRVCFRLTIYHRERIPKTGGVLLVANHVSYIDWLIFWLACPRPMTFVLWSRYYRHPVLRFFLSWARGFTIPVDDRVGRVRSIAESLRSAANALDAGRVVLIFPEGELTRTGNMHPFRRGVEQILRETKTSVTIVPAATCGLWNGFFSHGGGRSLRKLPKAFRPRLALLFGRPVVCYGNEESGKADKGSVHRAGDLRLAVQEVSADLAILESRHLWPVHRRFVRVAAHFRNLFRTAVVDCSAGPARTLTWAKMLVAALCVTKYLSRRIDHAPNVGIWLPTGLGGALANLALAFLGKAAVNLNYTAGPAAVRSAVRQAGIRTVVTARRFTSRMPLDLPGEIEIIYLEDALEAVTRWQRIRTFLLVLVLPGWVIDRLWLGLHRHLLDDVLTIVFSSGSTGEPKGVVLTHRNVAANTDASIRTLEIGPGESLFGILPFFHSFGFTVCLWAPLNAGCTAVYFPDPRQAKEVGDLARTHRVTLTAATATFLRFYLRRCNPDDFRTLRLIICGAEKLPVKLQDEFQAKFGILPYEGYGCTELSPVVSSNMADVKGDGFYQQRNCRGTVGQPIYGVCARAFSSDSATPLPVGTEGVLWVKGPNVMAGYLDQPEKTAAVVMDGWYNTGDAGLIEAEGFIRITGRVSRFAKVAGEMVPLEKLDEEMHDLLGSGDRVLAVSAVPDEKRGERLVVLYLSEIEGRLADLFKSLPKRGIPNLWIPDIRDCYSVAVMPILGNGKLDLKKLGEMAREKAEK
jgi:acyl-[acyl-carrier-protein]-phospholipid O-acyltransferase/long-chain-fatty-acid--[acyl-carrier-protein] ligase